MKVHEKDHEPKTVCGLWKLEKYRKLFLPQVLQKGTQAILADISVSARPYPHWTSDLQKYKVIFMLFLSHHVRGLLWQLEMNTHLIPRGRALLSKLTKNCGRHFGIGWWAEVEKYVEKHIRVSLDELRLSEIWIFMTNLGRTEKEAKSMMEKKS